MTSPNTFHADPIRDIPRYFRVFRTYVGVRMYLVFVLALFAAVGESVGIVMLLPLLQSLDGAGGDQATGPGAVLQTLLNGLGIGHSTVAILLLIAAFFLVKGVFMLLANSYNAYLRGQLLRELRARLYDNLSQMRLSYYVSKDTGHFVNIIKAQIDGFAWVFQHMVLLGTSAALALVYIAAAFAVAWRFGVMAFALGIILLAAFGVLNRYVRYLSRKHAIEHGILTKLLIQSLHGFKYLVATAQTPTFRRAIVASNERLTRQQVQLDVAQAFTGSVREPLSVAAVLVLVLIQIVWLDQALAPIMVSLLLFYRGLNAMLGLQSNWQEALTAIGAVEIVENEFNALNREREPDGDHEIGALTHSIQLRDVHFAYGGANSQVLKGISLTIPANTSVALVGESGAGKSTLVDLLTLMLKPTKGQVLIDGISSDKIKLGSWRRQIGYVSQETVIFDDTIAHNICLWLGDVNTDPLLFERVRHAAESAAIADFIETLPDKYQTIVGDRGVRLSGGQRQRLFIARELFKSPRVLILDEATSALDSESERAIQETMDALKGRMTLVIIAHRLATIRNVDRVFVIEGGKIAEDGTFDGLSSNPRSHLSRMVALQRL